METLGPFQAQLRSRRKASGSVDNQDTCESQTNLISLGADQLLPNSFLVFSHKALPVDHPPARPRTIAKW
jgi:hypothetical protein